jgi:hypothetical protein
MTVLLIGYARVSTDAQDVTAHATGCLRSGSTRGGSTSTTG